MRSTWVINIRRQQYRLHPSWSIASLVGVSANSTTARRDKPFRDTILQKLQVALPQVSNDLFSETVSSGLAAAGSRNTVPFRKRSTARE